MFVELFPYWCYLVGSGLFATGTVILIWRAYNAVH
jgi:hypothetical protein